MKRGHQHVDREPAPMKGFRVEVIIVDANGVVSEPRSVETNHNEAACALFTSGYMELVKERPAGRVTVYERVITAVGNEMLHFERPILRFERNGS